MQRPGMSHEQMTRFETWAADARTTNPAFVATVEISILPDKLANEFVTPQDIDNYLDQLEKALATMRSGWRYKR